ncbi:hypothetical protein IE077_003392 [Cardiosporidium cionae]|uniref:RING-type domain-containing protein n=1 Tax=Cardiosporidium cionae TaxID=476202 RepID=A0ABQ7JG09_9APIC|nr:hypothetical protein IE077_003392 [Cardiosporidium cionae]|eukprot:KAF8822595.1 hypothetical protein IE077_003392 [Cardiosporidium cionae]
MGWTPPSCCICYEDLATNVVALSSCGHIFHDNCLKDWLKRSKSSEWKCPLCRSSVANKSIIKLLFSCSKEFSEYTPCNDVEEIVTMNPKALRLRLSKAESVLSEMKIEEKKLILQAEKSKNESISAQEKQRKVSAELETEIKERKRLQRENITMSTADKSNRDQIVFLTTELQKYSAMANYLKHTFRDGSLKEFEQQLSLSISPTEALAMQHQAFLDVKRSLTRVKGERDHWKNLCTQKSNSICALLDSLKREKQGQDQESLKVDEISFAEDLFYPPVSTFPRTGANRSLAGSILPPHPSSSNSKAAAAPLRRSQRLNIRSAKIPPHFCEINEGETSPSTSSRVMGVGKTVCASPLYTRTTASPPFQEGRVEPSEDASRVAAASKRGSTSVEEVGRAQWRGQASASSDERREAKEDIQHVRHLSTSMRKRLLPTSVSSSLEVAEELLADSLAKREKKHTAMPDATAIAIERMSSSETLVDWQKREGSLSTDRNDENHRLDDTTDSILDPLREGQMGATCVSSHTTESLGLPEGYASMADSIVREEEEISCFVQAQHPLDRESTKYVNEASFSYPVEQPPSPTEYDELFNSLSEAFENYSFPQPRIADPLRQEGASLVNFDAGGDLVEDFAPSSALNLLSCHGNASSVDVSSISKIDLHGEDVHAERFSPFLQAPAVDISTFFGEVETGNAFEETCSPSSTTLDSSFDVERTSAGPVGVHRLSLSQRLALKSQKNSPRKVSSHPQDEIERKPFYKRIISFLGGNNASDDSPVQSESSKPANTFNADVSCFGGNTGHASSSPDPCSTTIGKRDQLGMSSADGMERASPGMANDNSAAHCVIDLCQGSVDSVSMLFSSNHCKEIGSSLSLTYPVLSSEDACNVSLERSELWASLYDQTPSFHRIEREVVIPSLESRSPLSSSTNVNTILSFSSEKIKHNHSCHSAEADTAMSSNHHPVSSNMRAHSSLKGVQDSSSKQGLLAIAKKQRRNKPVASGSSSKFMFNWLAKANSTSSLPGSFLENE